jgi:hypothetical protein
MEQEPASISPENLKLFKHHWNSFDEAKSPQTPNEWFVQCYPVSYEKHGSPFLELVEPHSIFIQQISPISINLDFFASVLGGRSDLGHHVVYYECELAWYFKDSDSIYKPTTAEKLANLYRALLMKCAQEMPQSVHKLNLFHEWRSDKYARSVVQRAKSILAADSSFFSPTSPHQRIRGVELHERLMRVLCESMLERKEGACLTVTQAYLVFCQLAQQRQLSQLKRSMFKTVMCDLVKDVHGLGLRRDVPDTLGKQQEAWRGLKLVEVGDLAA